MAFCRSFCQVASRRVVSPGVVSVVGIRLKEQQETEKHGSTGEGRRRSLSFRGSLPGSLLGNEAALLSLPYHLSLFFSCWFPES